jgi:hypothetical protein
MLNLVKLCAYCHTHFARYVFQISSNFYRGCVCLISCVYMFGHNLNLLGQLARPISYACTWTKRESKFVGCYISLRRFLLLLKCMPNVTCLVLINLFVDYINILLICFDSRFWCVCLWLIVFACMLPGLCYHGITLLTQSTFCFS